MNKAIEIKLGTTIVSRINAIRMSDAERDHALSAMQSADQLVDAFVWTAKKIEQLGERLFLRSALRH